MPRWPAVSPERSGGWLDRVAAIERWLLPGECLGCLEPVGPGDDLICAVCRSRWRKLPQPQCRRCGQPVDGDTDCRVCPEWPEGFQLVRSAVWLDESARRAVHLLKYDGWRRITDSLAAVMDDLEPLAPGRVLVPIPLSTARRRSRGYNQSDQLARSLGRRRGLPVADVLVRTRDTRTQTALTPEERDANLREAFRAGGAVPELPVLVDDVFTTGATLRSAATALLASGATTVAAVTFGRAELPLAAISRMV